MPIPTVESSRHKVDLFNVRRRKLHKYSLLNVVLFICRFTLYITLLLLFPGYRNLIVNPIDHTQYIPPPNSNVITQRNPDWQRELTQEKKNNPVPHPTSKHQRHSLDNRKTIYHGQRFHPQYRSGQYPDRRTYTHYPAPARRCPGPSLHEREDRPVSPGGDEACYEGAVSDMPCRGCLLVYSMTGELKWLTGVWN